jgi:hypothetical protein
MADYFESGAHNLICDRTGFKIKSTEAKKEWNGLIVHRDYWEPRHPQDFVRGKIDKQTVKNGRPRPEPWYVTTNEVTPESL